MDKIAQSSIINKDAQRLILYKSDFTKMLSRHLKRGLLILFLLSCFILQCAEDTGWADIPQAKTSIGWASWYSNHDKTDPWEHVFNADGSRFDENAMTCATRDRDFGRTYKVTNLRNGKSVIVLKKDYGPARKYRNKELKRIVDLSKGAFSRIADLKKGVILVKVETVGNSLP